MPTMADLIADTKRMAYGSLAEQMNLISANAAAGATTLELELSVDGISPGTVVCSGLNTWWVKGVNAATNTLYVVPGYEGSPQAAVSIGDFITIRPRVTDWYLFSTLNDVIRSLSSPTNGLYRVDTWESVVDITYQTYEIPVEARSMVSLLRVRARYGSTLDKWMDLSNYRFQIQPDNNTVRLTADVDSNSRLQFVYAAPFTAATALDDDVVTDLGLSESMVDIPPLGAVTTLLRTTEARRGQVSVQGDPRRGAEVQAGANMSAAREFAREFRARVDDEYARLTRQYSIFRGM